jgi:hypothetical protein
MTDIVYVVINEAMPGYTKIGRTDNLEQRIRTLDNTSVPLPFECFYAARVNDSVFVEKQLHDAFADMRVRKNREYFEVAPERVVAALRLAALEDVTPGNDFVESDDDQKALDKARERRAVFNFSMVAIPVGAVLTFTRNSEVTCEVVSPRKVRFEGEVTSLSLAAHKALVGEGIVWKSVQGPLYWEYEGETLTERRERMESDED